jgi:hypothetical protein
MVLVTSLALICLDVLLSAVMLSFVMLSLVIPSVVMEGPGAVPSPWACSSVNKQCL